VKHRLNYAEIYITNVCNLSCTHCQSFNNFAFKGHQLWDEYQDEYTKLSTRIDFDRLQIIGGEPTLNPDFEKWIVGISNLWPNSKLEISTNGSRLDKINDNIYQVLSKNNGLLWLTCHNINTYNKMLDFSKQFLKEIVSDYCPDEDSKENWKISYNTIKDPLWPDCDTIEQFANLPDTVKQQFIEKHRLNSNLHLKTASRILVDKNGVEVRIDWSQTFVPSAIEVLDTQRTTLKYNSDPIQAHNNCYFKSCHQLNKGKLYKCPLVSVLPDFLNQFDVDVNSDDQTLAVAYQPVSMLDNDTTISNFIKNIDQPIPQCKFCPSKYDRHNFVGTDKKIKIISI
jgi:organic radical activating enzyme